MVKVYPPLVLKVFVCNIIVFMQGHKELPGTAEKVLKSIRREVDEEGLELPITEGGENGKKPGKCAVQQLGREVIGMQQERSGPCNQRGDIGSGLEDENEAAGCQKETQEGRSAT